MIALMEELALPRYGLSLYISEKEATDAPKHISALKTFLVPGQE